MTSDPKPDQDQPSDSSEDVTDSLSDTEAEMTEFLGSDDPPKDGLFLDRRPREK